MPSPPGETTIVAEAANRSGTSADILAAARPDGVIVFGAGNFAKALAEALRSLGIRVAAMVVSTPQMASHDGIPIASLAALDPQLRRLPMWIGVFNREADSDYGALAASLAAAGVRDFLTPPRYFDLVAPAMGWRYWLAGRSAYAEREPEIAAAIGSLADDLSRRQLEATIRFRRNGDPADLPRTDAGFQYFPDFMAQEPVRTFVDGGAFDGDTLLAARRHLAPSAAIAFEPDPANFAQLAATAGSLPFPVTCFPCGLSDRTHSVRASVGRGDASAVCADGEDSMQLARLDDCLSSVPVDYLKLDVEGHEMAALAGAENSLRRHRPRLAIAGYHRWDDVWRIPRFIRELDLGYRIAYRVHAHNTFESVFYAYRAK